MIQRPTKTKKGDRTSEQSQIDFIDRLIEILVVQVEADNAVTIPIQGPSASPL
jgi:hypothetical protein